MPITLSLLFLAICALPLFQGDAGDPEDAGQADLPPDPDRDLTLDDGILRGTEGADDLEFNDPSDPVIAGGNVVDQIDGGAGDDRLGAFLTGASTLLGGAGDDTIAVENGQRVDGGDGDDTLVVATYDLGAASGYSAPLIGDVGAATVTGGAGADRISVYSSTAEQLSGDTLVITDFDPAEDRLEIQLSREAESVNSLRIETDGDDALVLYDVFDASGDSPQDPYSHQIRLVGAAGVVLEDVGFVTSALQLGPDLLDGSDGDDVIALGGAGSGFEGGYIRGFAGDDLVTLAQDAPNSILALGDGEDSVTGFATAVVHLEAGDDFAELDGDGNTGGAPSTVTGGEGNDTISALNGRADIHGDAGDDVITGSNAAQIWGGDGDDRIEIVYQLDPEPGFPGIAAVYGGAGSDSVTGSTGADYIADGVLVDGEIVYNGVDAGTDNDLFDGGAGDDRLVYAGGDDTLLGGTGSDSLFAVHFDTPTGGSAHFDGGFGDDTLAGSLGAADSLVGGAGDDLLMSAYLLQGETPVGDPQDGRIAYDHAVGDDVSDRLEGGGGDDTILFDRNDSVTGGRGADEFRLTLHDLVSAPDSGDGVARISDFDRSEDVLMIFVEDLASSTLTVSNGASGSTVFVNGSAVLEVEGVSDLTEFDLILSEGGPLAEEVAVTL